MLILTNILDFGIKSKYRLYLTIVVFDGWFDANDIWFILTLSEAKILFNKIKKQRWIGDIFTRFFLAHYYCSTFCQRWALPHRWKFCPVKLNHELFNVYILHFSPHSDFVFQNVQRSKGQRKIKRLANMWQHHWLNTLAIILLIFQINTAFYALNWNSLNSVLRH